MLRNKTNHTGVRSGGNPATNKHTTSEDLNKNNWLKNLIFFTKFKQACNSFLIITLKIYFKLEAQYDQKHIFICMEIC